LQDKALASRLPVIIYKPQSLISQAVYRIAEKIMHSATLKFDDDYDITQASDFSFQAAEEERLRRSRRLGRDKPKMERGDRHTTPTRFLFKSPMKTYGDPYKQAEYIYSLIESEA
jgi:hypothetical protein